MCEDYRSDGPEASVTTSSQPNGTGDSLVITAPCPVPLPRELSDPEKAIWEQLRYVIDEDHYGYGLGLLAGWKSYLPDTLDILESVSELIQPLDLQGKILALVSAMRRALNDYDIVLNLARDVLPYDRKLLRRIQEERGAVLMVPAMIDSPEDSTDPETLQ
jgi:hypothetical protein